MYVVCAWGHMRGHGIAFTASLCMGQPCCARLAVLCAVVGEDYGWRDRGWERGGLQFERGVAGKLKATVPWHNIPWHSTA